MLNNVLNMELINAGSTNQYVRGTGWVQPETSWDRIFYVFAMVHIETLKKEKE